MDQIFARRDVIASDRLRQLSRRSDARGWLQLSSHFAAITLTGMAIHLTLGSLWVVAPFLLHGVLINYLYGGQHELSHSTVFKTRWLNEMFGRLIGFILITPRDADQIQHFAHHRHTQLWRQDGELFRAPFTLRSYLLRLSGVAYWRANVTTLLAYAGGVVNEPYIRGDGRQVVIREARWHLAGYAAIAVLSIAAGSWAAVLYWLAPMLLTKPAHQLQNLIEHIGLPHSDDIFENTPQHAHECDHALDVLEHAVPHSPSRISVSALLPTEGVAPGDIHRAWDRAAYDDLFRIPARDHRGVAREG